MRILSLLVLSLLIAFYNRQSDSPHGPDFKVSCGICHSSKGWQLDTAIYSFDHNKTKLALTGQHTEVSCRQCHSSLVFSEAKKECNECHIDVHQATTGLDCERCHTPVSWLVNNITEIHQMSRFPLLGAHRTADCIDCHKSETLVRFDVPGVNCIDCHREVYMATKNPDHIESGFPEDCSQCHPINGFEWTGTGFNHSLFPLTNGHSGLECTKCHTTGNYYDADPDCYSCHQSKYNNTTNPNHQVMGFPPTCKICHDTKGWSPASFKQHDVLFPIYSGSHNGKWDSCSECHPDLNNYAVFDCKTCHANAHEGRNYTNAQCYDCHKRGTSPDK